MSEETKTETAETTTPEPKTLADSIIISRYEYIAAMDYANKFAQSGSKNKRMSSRSILRALFSAIDHGITNSKIKFTTEDEAKLAGVIAKILDLRTILQADKMNLLKNKTEEKKSEETSTSTEKVG
jgi:hypothetical protein